MPSRHRRPLPSRAVRLALVGPALALAACADPAPAPAPVALALLPERLELTMGTTLEGIVRVAPVGGPLPAVVWTTADTTVAVVAPGPDVGSAIVTARRPGETTLRARAASGGGSAELRVVVAPIPPLPADLSAPPPASVTVSGVTLRASTRADSAPAGAPAAAVRYTTTAVLRNDDAVPHTVRLDGCPLWLTLHRSATWYDTEARGGGWDQLAGAGACAAEGAAGGESVTLAPGAARELRTSVLTTQLFGTNGLRPALAPNATYHFHAHLRVDGAAAVVDAGAAYLSRAIAGLTFRGEAEVRGAARDTLVARVTVTNRGADTAYVEYGACGTRVLAWRTADRSGPPAWNSDRRQPWESPFIRTCLAYLVGRALAPGAELAPHEFSLTLPLGELLGDSLPDGRYWLTAQAGLQNAAAPVLDVGAFDLALARPALPAERPYDYVTYRAAPVTVAGDTVRATVTATLVHAASMIARLPRGCAVRLVAYRDRGRRDAAPRAGAPDWEQPLAGCPDIVDQLTLHANQPRTLETRAAVRDLLGAGLAPGRYAFAVYVRAPGRRVYLSAGEADLAR